MLLLSLEEKYHYRPIFHVYYPRVLGQVKMDSIHLAPEDNTWLLISSSEKNDGDTRTCNVK
jgi:hypothetical protein